jgi:penicillin-binding protein 1A
MRDALKYSRNIYAIKMIYDVGARKVADFGKRFGLTTRISPYFTLAVGSSEVLPYELISAYTTFPNGGERVKPIFVRRVEDSNGNILKINETDRIRVIDEKTAFLMADMMKSVVDEGTGVGIRWQPDGGSYKWNAAGKTGTTDDFRDAWFIGYNKELVTGVWVGFDDFSELGKSQSGATAALPTWPYIMKQAIISDSPLSSKGKPIINGSRYEFEKASGIISVEISKETGLLPRNSFDETIEEYFIAGTEPTQLSDSLNYNFYPTIYRENFSDSLVYDLGGQRYVWPDSIIYIETFPDTLDPEYMELVPREEPGPIDMRGATIIKNKEYVTRPDSMLYNCPDSLKHLYSGQSVIEEEIWQ